jgi:pSer/pThr/pTyr-binding forkhead associated (FHA) protein
MRLTIKVIDGPLAGLQTSLAEGQVASIGRSGRSDFAVPHDPYLSGRHAMVECTTDGCRIRDLKSTNGTWLNGSRVIDAHLLDGDTVLLGKTPLQIAIESSPDESVGPPQPLVVRTVQRVEAPPPGGCPEALETSFGKRLDAEQVRKWNGDESTEYLPMT